jgi:hypothetical protein
MKDDVIRLRVSKEDKALFKDAAKREEMKLSEWLHVAAHHRVILSLYDISTLTQPQPSVFDGSENDPLIKTGALKQWDQFEPKPPIAKQPKPEQKSVPAQKPSGSQQVKWQNLKGVKK